MSLIANNTAKQNPSGDLAVAHAENTKIGGLERSRSLVVVAMAPTLDRVVRDALLDAGADAVFERQADLQAYRSEAASIVSFWVRNQRLDAVGT